MREEKKAAPAAVAGPSGWKLVPVEPTNAMVRAAYEMHESTVRAIWSSMLRFAPTPAAQADSQPAPVAAFEVADAMADSQYLAGVSAGWNAANADDPNAALQKLHESRAARKQGGA